MSKHMLALAGRRSGQFNAAPILSYVKELIAARAARAALTAMSDGELDDIGLVRCRGGFGRIQWRPPCSP
jgi:uncharacterized protein YjiS (DUF1127 family)